MSRPIYEKTNDESASKIGQWVHDHEPATHDGIDIDHLVWKSQRSCLRIIEEKLAGEDLRPSQRRILPLLSKLIAIGKNQGILSDDSGVVVLYWWQARDARIDNDEGNLCAKFKVRVVQSDCIGEAMPIDAESVLDIVCGRQCSIFEEANGR